MITFILSAISFVRNSWIGKLIAAGLALLALFGMKKVYDSNRRAEGREQKKQEDLKQIAKKVEAQKIDERQHQHLEGDELAEELRRQQQEYRK